MLYAYPVTFQRDQNGTMMATVPDVPGTMTVGADREEALERVQGALVAMLAARMEDRETIPKPSRPLRGQRVVSRTRWLRPRFRSTRQCAGGKPLQRIWRDALGWEESRVRRVLDVRRRSPYRGFARGAGQTARHRSQERCLALDHFHVVSI